MIMILSSARAGFVLWALVAGSIALAQDQPRDPPRNGGAGLRSNNITSTGETVPNPGASQGAGVTSMDRGVEQRDTKIQSSICKGC